ncbi:MAG: hypothetical protein K2K41_05975 [Ruminiclostridium sp.]|nr:hypothetical protein [Ruminiclostridium sp.]
MVSAEINGGGGILSYLGSAGSAIAKSRYRINEICEIRLRAGKPIALETVKGRFTLEKLVTIQEIGECIKTFCNYSLHSYEREIKSGYITLKGGHRAGFCGTAVIKEGKLETIKDISSINLRIAREITGCGERLADIVFADDFRGLLIAGKPMSGKTTILRDICRIIGGKNKLAIIDSRGEIGAVYGGIPQNDIGVFTDVLNGYGKADGIEIATRTLSPDYIACDEITGEENSVDKCLNSGVKTVFTLHCGTLEQAKQSEIVKTGAISHIAFLKGKLGQIVEIIGV